MFRQRSAGFTLVEVLVALTILALILGTILGSLRVTSRSWETAMARADGNEALRLGLHFLRREIEQAVPIHITDGDHRRLMFQGTSNRLQLVAPLPAHTAAGALHRLTLSWLAAEEGRGALMVAYQPLHSVRDMPVNAGMNDPAAEMLPVIEGIGPVSFRYYGKKRRGDPLQWHAAWNNESRLPKLVQVLFDGDRDAPPWPEVTVALRADTQPVRAPFVIELGTPKHGAEE